MISFERFRLYTQKAEGIRFGRDPEEPHMLVYFSENSTLIEDYPYLNLRPMDFRNVVVPITRIPKSRITSGLSSAYQSLGLKAFSSNQRVPQGQNFIFDLSMFLNELDKTYEPANYRQRAGFLIKNILMRSFTMYSGEYNKTLLYSINTQKEFLDVRNRRVFPILEQIKEEQFYFENMLLNLVSERGTSYRLLMKDGDYDFKKLYNYIRMIKPRRQEEIEKEESNVHEEIYKNVSNVFSEENMSQKKQRIKSALSIYFNANKDEYQKAVEGELDEKEMKRLAIKSVLYNVSGDINKANRVANSVPENKQDAALKSIENNYLDEVLEPGEAESFSKNVINGLMDITGAVDNIAPDQLFNKRQIDFQKNLVQDVTNIFKHLENKDYPLKVQDVKVEDKPPKAGELVKSDVSVITIKLKDAFDQDQTLQIEAPKIDPESGTFRIDGIRQCLTNQIVECPITFPKPYDSKFESSYSKFHIWSKRTKRKKYLEMYMGTFILPFLVFMGYGFGLDDTFNNYGINYEISETKPSKDKNFHNLGGKYIVFDNVDTELKQEITDSIKQIDFTKYDTGEEIGSKEFFAKIIESHTGRVNSTYLIDQNIENIVDPTSEHTLFNMQLPTDLKSIIYYMASRVVRGYTIERNDLNNQRVRNSEVFSHLVQNQVNAAYTQYRQQVLSGNTEAKLDIRKDSALHNFKLSEIVIPMEYANPVEEMSSITRVAPTGRSIGGIPDRRAIQTKALNVHDSYFGNIDPLDTPESNRIGLVQQLTIGALLSSSRGLFRIKEISDNEATSMLSTTTCLVPFLENNDGARVLMYSNQAKQMLPLKNPQPPVIQSGYESILPKHLSSVFNKKSPCKGKIEKIERDKISIRCDKDKKIQEVDITPAHLRSGSGKDTLSVFRPDVNEGDKVEANSIIAEGGSMSQGQISLGKNLLTAVMPYAGYNFEDAILISDRLYKEDTLTSLHGIQETVNIAEEDRIVSMVSVGDETNKGDTLLQRTVGDLEELIGYHEEDEEVESNIDVSGREVSHLSPGGTVVDVEVFTNIEEYEEKFPQLKELINKTNKKYKKPKGEKYTFRGKGIEGVRINFKIEQELPIGVGDKLANRYGNKGIISRVMSHDQMPVTPWGEHVDIVLNPLGIIGRMNMGQLFELYCGLISRAIADRIKENKTKKNIVDLFSRVMPKLDNTRNKEFSKKFINKLRNLSREDTQKFIDQIEKDGLTPVVIPPFKAPKYSQIMEALKELDLKSGYNLKLPEFGGQKTKNEVPIGYMYITKLEHIGAEKLNARSTGPVKSKSLQPTQGKKASGGQRQGENDAYSLLSYDAIQTLNEMFGALSDDHATKSEMISDIVEEGNSEYKKSKQSPTRDLVNAYFTALMLDE